MPNTTQVFSFTQETHMESVQWARPVLGPRAYAGPAPKEDTIESLYKLQSFIVTVPPPLLLLLNRMWRNSPARVNEPSPMEARLGKPGDGRREQGVKKKYRSECVLYYKLSFDLSFMVGLDFPFQPNSRILWLKHSFTEWIFIYRWLSGGGGSEVNLTLSLPSRGLQGNKIHRKILPRGRLKGGTDEGQWIFWHRSTRLCGEVAFE